MIDENEFFRQATLRICGSLNLHAALGNLLDYLKNVVPVNGITLGLFDPAASAIHTTAFASLDGKKRPPSFIIVPNQFKKLAISDWSKQIRVFNDLDKEGPWVKKVLPADCSTLSVMFVMEGERIGGLSMWVKGKNRYTDTHCHLMSLLREPLTIAYSNALKHKEVLRFQEMLADDNRYLHQQLLQTTGDTIIGESSGLKNVMEMVHQVARLDSPVLLFGETGVGKEVIANAIHHHSGRRNGPLIKVNCGAIPDSLMDSELFGHEKGAFTGADARKRGRFERAHNGTIFLDEIGELPPAAQVRLLRVIQNKEIERVGGSAVIPVNVRIISATHQNLEEMINIGSFREDLWYRLNVFPVIIPPLRQRKEDIPSLVHYFLEKKSMEMKIQAPPISAPSVLDKLMSYSWPGNVRELENIVERSLIQSQGKQQNGFLVFEGLDLSSQDIQKDRLNDAKKDFLCMEETMRSQITQAMEISNGKVEGPDGAAQLLKLHPSTLRYRMRKLGIPHGRGKY